MNRVDSPLPSVVDFSVKIDPPSTTVINARRSAVPGHEKASRVEIEIRRLRGESQRGVRVRGR
jgi:hypothetical protein